MFRTLAIFIFALAALPAVARAYVNVKREPAVIEHKIFDPANPPPDMPHLNPGEAALTASDFQVKAKVDYEVVSRDAGPAGVTAVVSVRGVIISTQLHVIVYLPAGATEKLKAHEEGHRQLAEKIYTDYAIAAARAAAAPIDGRRFTGQGPDWKTAAQNAVKEPVHEMGVRYLDLTAQRSSEVNDTYDALTRHGTNSTPEAVAMAQALAKYENDHPTTQPAKAAKAR